MGLFRRHPVGFLKVPANLNVYPNLMARVTPKFTAPATCPTQDYCTPTEDQGEKPWCAAYSCAGMVENIHWRKNDYWKQIDPQPIYEYAKTIDGDPTGDGTTLTAVLQCLLDTGVFDKEVCSIRTLRPETDDIKYAIHKFGCALCGFAVTEEWESKDKEDFIIRGENEDENTVLGGHAVLACGYDRAGVTIQNSWGLKWGRYGFATVSWEAFRKQFIYGAVLDRCLDGFRMNG